MQNTDTAATEPETPPPTYQPPAICPKHKTYLVTFGVGTDLPNYCQICDRDRIDKLEHNGTDLHDCYKSLRERLLSHEDDMKLKLDLLRDRIERQTSKSRWKQIAQAASRLLAKLAE